MTEGRPRVAVLAGGRSERFAPGGTAPKALARIGGRTLLDHVIQRYVDAGLRSVAVATGHHRDAITAHVAATGDPRDLEDHVVEVVREDGVRVLLVDTGREVGTGARVARVARHLADPFHLAWCDVLLDVDPAELAASHQRVGAAVTMVVAHPPTRFGRLWLDGDEVVRMEEKPVLDDVWVSAGMFVVDHAVLPSTDDPGLSWEEDVLPRAAKDGRVHAHRHDGFWAAIDTSTDLTRLRDHVGDATPWRLGGGLERR